MCCSYYLKAFVANSRVPVGGVSIRTGGQSSFAEMIHTSDNGWLLNSGVPLVFPADVMVSSVLGDVIMDTIATTDVNGPPVVGAAQFPHHPELECTSASPNTTAQPACGDYCSSPYANKPLPVGPAAGAQSAFDVTNVTTGRGDNCSLAVAAQGQCGGNTALCQGSQCVDGQWPGACCSSGYSCNRKSSAFWQCELNSGPGIESVGTVAAYEQCGGTTNCAGNTTQAAAEGLPLCFDGVWTGAGCQSGFICTRFSREFWRCDTLYPQLSGSRTQSADALSATQAAVCAA